MLPLAAFLAATYVIKSPKWAIYFWIASIGVSLVAGGTMVNFFAGLGFDDRMSAYGNSMDQYADSFSSTGFRWDFLAYSAMPVWLTWYVTKKAETERALYGDTVEEAETNIAGAGRIADAHSMRVFNILATTYILANSFWVMVIKAAFSNRFAYLSWFLYPVVLAYAVIRLHIWPDQDRKAGLILLLHAGFTIIMFMLGKA
jgi:cytochrome bd-type quinol oxidase subunit 2